MKIKLLVILSILLGASALITLVALYINQTKDYMSLNWRVHLIDNRYAINPSFNQVIDFLKYDQTDKLSYQSDKFNCADFAATLHNNAEKYGYRCGLAIIDFTDGLPGHACNAFETTDRGIIYIDSSNGCSQRCENDMVVEVGINKEYRPARLFDCNDNVLRFTSIGVISNYDIFWSGAESK